MLEILEKKIATKTSDEEKINIIREFLQILILKILRDKNAFRNMAFIGGTALRILYDLNRYSEDLDFSLVNSEGYDFVSLMAGLKKELEMYNLSVDLRYKTQTINSCFVGFNNILQYFNLKVPKDQKLQIKIENDTKPPQGAELEDRLINDEFVFDLRTYKISSLMAGKLNAIFSRTFDKGRDYYDLIWYLSKKIEPNFALLENSLKQFHKEALKINKSNWKNVLLKELENKDFKQIRQDVEKFLIYKDEVEMIKMDTFKKLLGD